jgi:hypothetical protein
VELRWECSQVAVLEKPQNLLPAEWCLALALIDLLAQPLRELAILLA